MAKSNTRGENPGFAGISRIAGERGEVSTSNHLILNTNANAYLCAKFGADPRYKNVQGHIVGEPFTAPRAQVQSGHGVRVSYYMKGKSERVV